jgi:hypothetical protein
MAVYKVIQDVEAEDKIVGFLTLKTFIYALIAATLGYINVRFLIAGELGPLRFVFVLILSFPMLIFGLLAAPLGRDQPTEVWILSHVKFYLNSRKRLWDQSGAQDLVTITAPKKFEKDYTKGLSQNEVQSRLRALATTLDSRGWAVKNVAVNLTANPSYLDVEPADSDRLISASSVAQDEAVDVQASDDIMDEQNNPTAQHFEALMQQADARRKVEVINRVNEARQEKNEAPKPAPIDSSFLDQTNTKGETKFVGHKVIAPGTDNAEAEDSAEMSADEKALLDRIHQKAEEVHKHSAGFKPKTHKHHKAKKPGSPPVKTEAKAVAEQPKPEKLAVTENPQNAKLKELMEVAKSDKLSTLAKEAKRQSYEIKQTGPNEVEIDLHI